MTRREFIAGLGCAIATWPLAARAQHADHPPRRVGILLSASKTDSEYPSLLQAFLQELERLGWADRRNIKIDVRWGEGSPQKARAMASELVGLRPDVILAPGGASMGPLHETTRDIPVVFTIVPDPVAAGFVDSLARPGGNATGFTSFEYGIGGKWLGLLKEIAPRVKRVAVLRDTGTATGSGQVGAIQTAASAFGVEISPINAAEAPQISKVLSDLGRSGNAGIVVTSSASAVRHRDLIVRMTAEQKIPAVYYGRVFAAAGGLVSYGPDRAQQFRQAAGYVDRILKGEKTADLPVQGPTKYELVVNAKTAKALGIELPSALLARADEVIE
jgi:putative tryptophan/tyrosine transport system substrate-binding protein